MSFIDMMANDVWSDSDIKTRLHAMIRSEFSAEVEEELSRAVMGATLRQHTITAEEGAKLGRFKELTDVVSAEGAAARADWAVLKEVMAYELAARQAKVEHDIAFTLSAERDALLLEDPEADAGEAIAIPDLLPDPLEDDPIFLVWRMRNPAPEPVEEVLLVPEEVIV